MNLGLEAMPVSSQRVNISSGASGNLVYTVLPADGEPCGLDFPPFRPLWEIVTDLDGLDLPQRYPFARHPMKNDLGVPFSATNPQPGTYVWLDLEGRNVWYGGEGGVYKVIGEDTGGMEIFMDSGFNQEGSRKRYMRLGAN